jgi:crotonobetainyl-CoA:carnitine CoA-transferase CaiB-like acyl-CoA transferase
VGYWADPAKNVDMSVLELQAVVLPRLAQVIDGDANAALGLLAALALGLYHQARTGEGQILRTSMLAGNAWAYSDDFCAYDGKRPVPLCDDEYFGTSALDRVYPAADGTWLCIHVPTDKEFAALADALDGQIADERFADPAAREALDAHLVAALGEAFAKKSAGEWQSELSAAGVGCAEVSMRGHAPTTAFDPVLREMGLTTTFDHPLFGELVRAAPPVTFSESAGRVDVPCRCGEQSRSILAELGYPESEIDELEASGVISSPSSS